MSLSPLTGCVPLPKRVSVQLGFVSSYDRWSDCLLSLHSVFGGLSVRRLPMFSPRGGANEMVSKRAAAEGARELIHLAGADKRDGVVCAVEGTRDGGVLVVAGFIHTETKQPRPHAVEDEEYEDYTDTSDETIGRLLLLRCNEAGEWAVSASQIVDVDVDGARMGWTLLSHPTLPYDYLFHRRDAWRGSFVAVYGVGAPDESDRPLWRVYEGELRPSTISCRTRLLSLGHGMYADEALAAIPVDPSTSTNIQARLPQELMTVLAAPPATGMTVKNFACLITCEHIVCTNVGLCVALPPRELHIRYYACEKRGGMALIRATTSVISPNASHEFAPADQKRVTLRTIVATLPSSSPRAETCVALPSVGIIIKCAPQVYVRVHNVSWSTSLHASGWIDASFRDAVWAVLHLTLRSREAETPPRVTSVPDLFSTLPMELLEAVFAALWQETQAAYGLDYERVEETVAEMFTTKEEDDDSAYTDYTGQSPEPSCTDHESPRYDSPGDEGNDSPYVND